MSSSELPAAAPKFPAPKPSAPPALQWLMCITGIVALLLFLTPTFYVVKYYALDRPHQTAIAQSMSPLVPTQQIPAQPDYALLLEIRTRNIAASDRQEAVKRLGELLTQPGIGWKRPLECLSAKATLAELATKDPDLTVRATASEELGKVAQGGAVIRR